MVPRFCPIHQKIHVCDEQNPINKNKAIDKELGSKVRRLHGIQTEEDIAKQERLATQQPEKGTLAYILNHAKAANSKIKAERKEYEDKDGNTVGVSDTELSSRMAMLRSRLNGGGNSPSQQYTPPNKDAEAEYIAAKAERGEQLSLREVVELAKHKNVHSTKNKEYKPPQRSNMAPNYISQKEEEEETIYRARPKKSIEEEIKNAKAFEKSSRTTNRSRTVHSSERKSPSRTSERVSSRRTATTTVRERPVKDRTTVRERPVKDRTTVRERPARERAADIRERPARERRAGEGNKPRSTSTASRIKK